MLRRRDTGTGSNTAGHSTPAVEQKKLDSWRQTACYSLASTDCERRLRTAQFRRLPRFLSKRCRRTNSHFLVAMKTVRFFEFLIP
jgi:hypothetical protein